MQATFHAYFCPAVISKFRFESPPDTVPVSINAEVAIDQWLDSCVTCLWRFELLDLVRFLHLVFICIPFVLI